MPRESLCCKIPQSTLDGALDSDISTQGVSTADGFTVRCSD